MARFHRQYEQLPNDVHLDPISNSDYAASRGLSDDYYYPVSANHSQVHLNPAPIPAPSPAPGPAPAPVRPNNAFGQHAVQHHRLHQSDRRLKLWIRFLKFAARVVSAVLSIVSFVPVAMTLSKYYATKDTYYNVDGHERTAWPTTPTIWYSYLYAAVNLVSMILNVFIILSYCRSIRHANKADDALGWWSTFTTGAQILFYAVAVAIYRYGKEPVNGHFKDLWGWSCSGAANRIQASVLNVNFGQYCSIQSLSFDLGATNVVTAILSAVIYLLSVLRLRSKRRINQVARDIDAAMMPLNS